MQAIQTINERLKYLITNDTLVWSTIYANNFLIALFLSDRFGDQAVQVVSIGAMITFISRAVFQIPVAKVLDSMTGIRDEVYAIAVGSSLILASFLLFPYVYAPWQYYVIQIIIGIGVSIDLPAFRKMFAASITIGNEGKQYAIYDTILTSLSAVVIALMGMAVYNTGNFNYLFYPSAALILLGIVVILRFK